MYEEITSDVDDPKLNVVDLRTDCATKATKGMKERMMNAKTGDDEGHEDKSTIELETLAAKMLKKEAALFMPTATMSNLIAGLIHCTDRSSEIIVGEKSHMFRFEQASVAKIGSININPIPQNPDDGTFSMEDLQDRIREISEHEPRTCMIAIENTQNHFGGLVLPLAWLDELAKVAEQHKIPVHTDGAHLFQSVIALGSTAERVTKGSTSVTVALTKIGAPMLVGPKAFIKEARRMRKGLGAQMTQSGYMAAAGVEVLTNHIQRIKDDQVHAKQLATAIHDLSSKIMYVNLTLTQSNIFLVHVNKKIGAKALSNRLMQVTDAEKKELKNSIVVLTWPRDKDYVRMVTSLHINPDKVKAAIAKFEYVAKEFATKYGVEGTRSLHQGQSHSQSPPGSAAAPQVKGGGKPDKSVVRAKPKPKPKIG